MLMYINKHNWSDFKTNKTNSEKYDENILAHLSGKVAVYLWLYEGYILRMYVKRIPKQVSFWTPMNIRKLRKCLGGLKFLKYQVETMRTMTESRNLIYEEIDKTAQDLESNNKKLEMEARADKQKIEKLAT